MVLSVSVCRPKELSSHQLDIWREVQAANSSLFNPFLTPEFACIFGEHRPDVRVAVVEEDGQICGFLAFELGPLRSARALAYGLADAQSPILHPDSSVSLSHILDAAGLAVLEYDHLVVPDLADSSANHELQPSPLVDVGSATWDEWLESKRKMGNSRRIKSALEKRRKLERQRGTITFDFDCRDRKLLQELMMWKSRQYRRTGRPDRFAKAWFRSTMEDLFDHRDGELSSRLSVMYVEERPVTIDFSLTSHGVLAGWFPSYDPEFAHYSPGFNGILEIIRSIGSDPKIDALDMGKGASAYKESLKTREVMVAEGWQSDASAYAKLWRAKTEPRRRALQIVLGNPRLRIAARRTLNQLGKLRGA